VDKFEFLRVNNGQSWLVIELDSDVMLTDILTPKKNPINKYSCQKPDNANHPPPTGVLLSVAYNKSQLLWLNHVSVTAKDDVL